MTLDRRTLLGGGVAAPALLRARRAWADDAIADTAGGKLLGAATDVFTFRSIPYATPPLGKLRLMSPRPAAPWDGVRDARARRNAPIQTISPTVHWIYDSAEPQGEDCLTLNVWTPALQGQRPVMVWIYGGAWRTGHSDLIATNGARLARDGNVVVVAMNYRLGAFGWLGHPDLRDPDSGTAANWGYQDQIAALRWVRANIDAFGGDPGQVTVFGQSAGGWSVVSLAQNSDTAPLMRRGICMSGGLQEHPAFLTLDEAATYAEVVAAQLKVPVRGLRDVPAPDLARAEAAASRIASAGTLARAKTVPVLDGVTVKSWTPEAPLAPIPLLIGSTRSEATFYFDLIAPDGTRLPGFPMPADEEAMRQATADLAGLYVPDPGRVDTDIATAAYIDGAPDLRSAWLDLYTDVVYRMRALQVARHHAAAGHPTFVYEFDHPLRPPARGVPHTSDIPFVFGTFGDPFFAPKVGDGPDEAALSATMLGAFAAFAHSGDPATARTGPWPGFTPAAPTVARLAAPHVTTTPAPRDLGKLDRWAAVWRT